MNQQQQRMAAVGTDKELSDLLDFSMMFPLPVANGKNRPTTLASTQFGGSGLDERPGSGSWGTGDQNSSTFDQGRQNYGEGPHYGEHRDLPSHNSISSSPFLGPGLVGKSSERASYSTFGRDTGMPGLNQLRPGFPVGQFSFQHLHQTTLQLPGPSGSGSGCKKRSLCFKRRAEALPAASCRVRNSPVRERERPQDGFVPCRGIASGGIGGRFGFAAVLSRQELQRALGRVAGEGELPPGRRARPFALSRVNPSGRSRAVPRGEKNHHASFGERHRGKPEPWKWVSQY